jgi:hypothetical protein
VKKFESHCKNACKSSEDISSQLKTIESAINQALAGQDYDDLIILDDAKVDKDLFIEIMFKFFAVLRYEIYNKIQMYWKTN